MSDLPREVLDMDSSQQHFLNPPTPQNWPEYYVLAHEFDGYASFPDTL
jgi:hypothetical protein